MSLTNLVVKIHMIVNPFHRAHFLNIEHTLLPKIGKDQDTTDTIVYRGTKLNNAIYHKTFTSICSRIWAFKSDISSVLSG